MAWGERAEKVMLDTITGKAHEYVPQALPLVQGQAGVRSCAAP